MTRGLTLGSMPRDSVLEAMKESLYQVILPLIIFQGTNCKVLVTQSRPTLCNARDCILPGVHEILQARILEWIATSFSRGSSQPKDQTGVSCVSCIAGRFLTI